MSLMDLLLNAPSAQDRYQQIAPLMGNRPDIGTSDGLRALSGNPSSGSVEDQARQYFLSQGYSPQDFRKVDSIIGRESSWDPHAVNPSSGAAGIAQNISGFSKGYSRNDPMEQIRWLENYLANHNYEGYGTGIDAALAHKNATGWY